MKRCECCHQIIPPEIVLSGKITRAIYEYIASHPNGVQMRQITDYVYQDDPSGGPDFADISVSVLIRKINRTLKSYGLKIGSYRKHSGYKIIPEDLRTLTREQIRWHAEAATALSAAALYPSGT